MYDAGKGAHMPQHACSSQRETRGSCFSPFIFKWIWGLELRSPGFCGQHLCPLSHLSGPCLCLLKITFLPLLPYFTGADGAIFVTHEVGHFSLLHGGQWAVPLFINQLQNARHWGCVSSSVNTSDAA